MPLHRCDKAQHVHRPIYFNAPSISLSHSARHDYTSPILAVDVNQLQNTRVVVVCRQYLHFDQLVIYKVHCNWIYVVGASSHTHTYPASKQASEHSMCMWICYIWGIMFSHIREIYAMRLLSLSMELSSASVSSVALPHNSEETKSFLLLLLLLSLFPLLSLLHKHTHTHRLFLTCTRFVQLRTPKRIFFATLQLNEWWLLLMTCRHSLFTFHYGALMDWYVVFHWHCTRTFSHSFAFFFPIARLIRIVCHFQYAYRWRWNELSEARNRIEEWMMKRTEGMRERERKRVE